ncbi:hypothetical protein [Bartonella sp. LJL80]
MTGTYFLYSPATKEYLGSGVADIDQQNPDRYLYPAFSTRQKPPEVEEGVVLLWTGATWAGVKDYRGQVWFKETGEEVTIDFIGDPSERGLTADKPVLPEPEPVVPALTARQFWQAALVIGVTEEGLASEVSSPESPLYVADDEERESVLIDIKKTTLFSRDHYLVEKMAKAKDIPTEQLDCLWQWASNIQ